MSSGSSDSSPRLIHSNSVERPMPRRDATASNDTPEATSARARSTCSSVISDGRAMVQRARTRGSPRTIESAQRQSALDRRAPLALGRPPCIQRRCFAVVVASPSPEGAGKSCLSARVLLTRTHRDAGERGHLLRVDARRSPSRPGFAAPGVTTGFARAFRPSAARPRIARSPLSCERSSRHAAVTALGSVELRQPKSASRRGGDSGGRRARMVEAQRALSRRERSGEQWESRGQRLRVDRVPRPPLAACWGSEMHHRRQRLALALVPVANPLSRSTLGHAEQSCNVTHGHGAHAGAFPRGRTYPVGN